MFIPTACCYLVSVILLNNNNTKLLNYKAALIIPLKNQKLVTIRQAEIADAEGLLQCIKAYIPESSYIPKLEQEITLSIEQERAWINSFLISDNSLLLVAEYNNQIIGNIDLTGSKRKAMEHTAVIGMGLLKAWRNVGLGTQLLQFIIEWAKENEVLELIWLQVYTQNELALKVYRRVGFEENGVIKGFFKQNNTYFDNLTMSLKVK